MLFYFPLMLFCIITTTSLAMQPNIPPIVSSGAATQGLRTIHEREIMDVSKVMIGNTERYIGVLFSGHMLVADYRHDLAPHERIKCFRVLIQPYNKLYANYTSIPIDSQYFYMLKRLHNR